MYYGQFGMNIVNSFISSNDGFESMCEPICICCECGIILFPCDVKWVDSRIEPPSYPMA